MERLTVENAAFYNDNDPKVCAWLRELMADKLITQGTIDERPIEELKPDDIRGYRRVHCFAGIAGWERALQLAGWPADRPVWSASLPCQPWSCAGKQKGSDDARHVWPHFLSLVKECRPECIVGEQVWAAIKLDWLDGIFEDMERENYTCGAVVLGAHSIGAPHIRQRIFWVAYSERAERWPPGSTDQQTPGRKQEASQLRGGGHTGGLAYSQHHARRADEPGRGAQGRGADGRDCANGGMGDATPDGCQMRPQLHAGNDGQGLGEGCELNRLDNPIQPGLERHAGNGHDSHEPGRERTDAVGPVAETGARSRVEHASRRKSKQLAGTGDRPGEANSPGAAGGDSGSGQANFWANSLWHYCRDGKYRRVPARAQSQVFDVVDGVSSSLDSGRLEIDPDLFPICESEKGRVTLLKGAGNAIVAPLAAEFIKAVMEII